MARASGHRVNHSGVHERKNGATTGVAYRAARRRPETIAVQAGGAGDLATGAIVPPIHVATTFVRDADAE